VQGWAPADAAPALQALAEERRLALLVAPPSNDDQPPTLLRAEDDNKAMGGDLTRFYMSPGYRSWDPSLIVFVSFAIFFAMILADAGYALLIGGLTALYAKRLGTTATGRRMRALLVALSVAAFAYGVAAGSYFGFPPSPDGWLSRLVIVDVTDFQAMMRVSILLGAAHISLALAAVMWINGVSGKSLTALGWVIVMAGGLGMWLGSSSASGLGARVALAGPWVLAAGFAAVVIGGFLAQPRTDATGARIGAAVMGLTGATKLFGDLLSYLRLFALGLASASLAGTFNDLALDIRAAQPGIGLLFAILVLLFGHAINLVIGLMSGVVHGLRLNYIEFFGWGLPDEGYPFRPFAKRESTA
jgi:V/A-type H+-transporting ATPase subunit I